MRPDHPDDAGRVPLHQRRAEHLGEHHEVALGPGRPVEDRPLVVVVAAADQPAGEPVGEPAGAHQRHAVDLPAGDGEARPHVPGARVGGGIDDRAVARDPALVDLGSQGVVDVLEEEGTPRVVDVEGEARLGQLLGQPPHPRRARAGGHGHPVNLPTIGQAATSASGWRPARPVRPRTACGRARRSGHRPRAARRGCRARRSGPPRRRGWRRPPGSSRAGGRSRSPCGRPARRPAPPARRPPTSSRGGRWPRRG